MTIPLTLRRSRAASRLHPRHAAGFTLTEILIAIALIVIIVGVAVANYSKIYVSGQIAATKTFVNDDVDTPLMDYRLNTQSFPTTEQGLRALIAAPDNVAGWNGPYLKTAAVPLDPWGHEYHYVFPGTHNPTGYDCWSDGPDGVSGTADDIGNW